MSEGEFDVVTGAFSYTGKYIAGKLLSMGRRVKTLTGHPGRPNPFGATVAAAPFNFDDFPALTAALRGAAILYNTYWVRFPFGRSGFDEAIRNTRVLIRACREAGVGRIVHISISNPSGASHLPYFRGKAELEQAIIDSTIPYTILRPTVIFGREDILINNIAWLLRRFPLFAIPGNGDYRLQPVFVEDVAELAVSSAQGRSSIINAAGPETYTFNSLVRRIALAVRSTARIFHVGPRAALLLSGLVGRAVSDVILTRDEVEGLMSNLLVTEGPPAGRTSLSDWLSENASLVGSAYASEVARHF